MNYLDYSIIFLYLAALLAFGYMFRHQSDKQSYFLGGRSLGWFPLTLSTMATQLSAISFVSAPSRKGDDSTTTFKNSCDTSCHPTLVK